MGAGVESTGGPHMAGGIERRGLLRCVPAIACGLAWPSAAVDLRIAPDASGTALADALDRAVKAGGPSVIGLAPGLYREKVRIDTPGLTLRALGPGVVIAFGAAAGLPRPGGGKWGTAGSATLSVEASDVRLIGLTVRNDFDYVADTVTNASGGAQAVALSIGSGADRVLVDRCSVEGYQDTLYAAKRALFRRCTISGGVDFIFGGAAALFDRCRMVTRHVPGRADQGFVAAPSTLADQRFGLVFDRCHIDREPSVPDGSTWLGRPWRAGGNMAILGAAAFLRCRVEGHVKAAGWTSMGFTDPSGIRRQLEPGEARLFEYGSTGPGSGLASLTRRRLNAAQAAGFTPANILNGWAP